MSPEPTQSYANHSRMVTGFHYVTLPMALIYLLWTIWFAATSRTLDAHFRILGALALCGTAFYARTFALKAQDRVIRLEEQSRMARLLPDDLHGRVDELSVRQLIALRFAADSELPELVRWVLKESVTDPKLIKQRIKVWRPDTHRV